MTSPCGDWDECIRVMNWPELEIYVGNKWVCKWDIIAEKCSARCSFDLDSSWFSKILLAMMVEHTFCLFRAIVVDYSLNLLSN